MLTTISGHINSLTYIIRLIISSSMLHSISGSKFFGFTLSVSFHHGSPYPFTQMNNRPVDGCCSSQTLHHPIKKNNSKHNRRTTPGPKLYYKWEITEREAMTQKKFLV
jgi:hypothetical protein